MIWWAVLLPHDAVWQKICVIKNFRKNEICQKIILYTVIAVLYSLEKVKKPKKLEEVRKGLQKKRECCYVSA